MVTANLNRERQRSPDIDDNDDESNNRQIQNRLDRLYLENIQFNRMNYQQQYQPRTLSPINSRDMYMPTNTVPVYRHGRKFYVPVEEYERMRAEERQHRRLLIQKSQNLPLSKSQYQTNLRPSSTSLYNPLHRSTSHSNEYRYGVLHTPHLPANSIINPNNDNRYSTTRQSRTAYRYYDDRDDLSSIRIPLSPTTRRSNSSDKVLDLRRIPQPSIQTYDDSDDYEIKRSFSAEDVQPPQVQLSQPPVVAPRRTVVTTASDYGVSAVSSIPVSSTDQTYHQSNPSKLTNYFNRNQSSTLNSSMRPSSSNYTGTSSTSYDTNIRDSNQVYSASGSSNGRTGTGLTSAIARSSSNNSNDGYYYQDSTNGSFSDDNSSSTPMSIPRRNTDTSRYRREYIIQKDDDYRPPGDGWTRSTMRSQSSDRLTEKKRVRFADMEGFTLETVPNTEQQRSPMNNPLITRRPYVQIPSNFQGQVQPVHNSFYPSASKIANSGSKLATDV